MTVSWPKLVASELNNKILLCWTETNKFIIVFQFYNTTGCPLQKNKLLLLLILIYIYMFQ